MNVPPWLNNASGRLRAIPPLLIVYLVLVAVVAFVMTRRNDTSAAENVRWRAARTLAFNHRIRSEDLKPPIRMFPSDSIEKLSIVHRFVIAKAGIRAGAPIRPDDLSLTPDLSSHNDSGPLFIFALKEIPGLADAVTGRGKLRLCNHAVCMFNEVPVVAVICSPAGEAKCSAAVRLPANADSVAMANLRAAEKDNTLHVLLPQ